ncbi:GNAT family N-acetyltransferase [Eoetvoesiella caeni]|uniref:Acetyltransferase (GNAT) family protein n=1 Tax=Eoetvoesiella caeni TaxID=645616 RepID=A0A366HEB3_9BURK|nr:GNAT family N-acetyltransferase [Eoetvoesiella caeni]MCI2808932.1 GNAT family N-acetyltransferase [Eoetvoesiella caeni]NYT55567.1 GNAT family N-acetyltransferase [Eoetvoesiella caeni]RBP40122.1 acetyltransferase (GNAT) family protein [Eoetvoesiella caeni]
MALDFAPEHIGPLEKTHERKSFDCGHEDLNRYLREQARQDAEKRVAAPFVFTQPGDPKVLGFYTLSSSIISADELPVELMKRLPRYGQLPVTLLGRLAVDRSAGGQGVGEFLLVDALRRSLETAQQIAAMAVIVDAKNERAESFYRHFDFQPFQQTPLRLFLSMAQIAKLFE